MEKSRREEHLAGSLATVAAGIDDSCAMVCTKDWLLVLVLLLLPLLLLLLVQVGLLEKTRRPGRLEAHGARRWIGHDARLGSERSSVVGASLANQLLQGAAWRQAKLERARQPAGCDQLAELASQVCLAHVELRIIVDHLIGMVERAPMIDPGPGRGFACDGWTTRSEMRSEMR